MPQLWATPSEFEVVCEMQGVHWASLQEALTVPPPQSVQLNFLYWMHNTPSFKVTVLYYFTEYTLPFNNYKPILQLHTQW